jgi:type IV pilus assembly protein PilP
MNCAFQNRITGFPSIIISALLLAMLPALYGCQPPPEPPQKSAVVRKKIPSSPKPAVKTPPAVSVNNEAGLKAAKPAPEPAVVLEKIKSGKKIGKKEPDKPLTATASKTDTKQTVKDQLPEPYNSKGKPDPFLPFIKSKAERESDKEKNVNRRIPRTPLEKVDFSQMKLTAIVQSPAGNFGLIEESTGKGYVVSVGTFIGVNGGKIKQILDDRLVVEEEAEDVFGKITTREIEVKLNKPAGEF